MLNIFAVRAVFLVIVLFAAKLVLYMKIKVIDVWRMVTKFVSISVLLKSNARLLLIIGPIVALVLWSVIDEF